MPLVLLVPLIALVAVATGSVWVAARLREQLALLEAEVAALAQVRNARDVLRADVERTRVRFGRPAEVLSPGADR